MKTIGIRELKSRLSRYVRQAEAGETILVSRHDRVVAELRPHEGAEDDLPPGLREMARLGLATPGKPGRPEYPEFDPIGPPGTALRLLDEERGER